MRGTWTASVCTLTKHSLRFIPPLKTFLHEFVVQRSRLQRSQTIPPSDLSFARSVDYYCVTSQRVSIASHFCCSPVILRPFSPVHFISIVVSLGYMTYFLQYYCPFLLFDITGYFPIIFIFLDDSGLLVLMLAVIFHLLRFFASMLCFRGGVLADFRLWM